MKKVNYEKKNVSVTRNALQRLCFLKFNAYLKKNNKDGLEDRCDLEPPCSGNLITIFDGETIYALIIVIIE